MPARTGKQYIESLRRIQPCIYLNGRRVADVTQEALFQGPIQSIAQLYDLQFDPRYRDFMLYPSPTTGDPVHVAFQIPHSRQELVNKRKAFKLRTDHNFGFMGRTMDFMNAMVISWYSGQEKFARRGVRRRAAWRHSTRRRPSRGGRGDRFFTAVSGECPRR